MDLTIWVVLGGSNQEFIGQRSNAGCRLDQVEIGFYIQQLRSNKNFFASNSSFLWDGQFPATNTIHFTGLFNGSGSGRYRSKTAFLNEVMQLQPHWQADHINIYFTGAIDNDDNEANNFPTGWTLDPRDPGAQDPYHPCIIINDGGPKNAAGWNGQWAAMKLLEHEMTHFLGRFTNSTHGVFMYDGMEHVPNNASNQANNVLVGGDQQNGYKLKLGRDEKARILERIVSGNWANP